MREGEPTREEEKSPEILVADAVSAIENREALDSVSGSRWAETAKEFFGPAENWGSAKNISKGAGTGLFWSALIGLGITYKVLEGAFKFAKKAIEKKGKIGFKDGYEIGKEMFSFGDKKENKK
jgi:hypothetical protein